MGLSGTILGLRLEVFEQVVERDPPRRKTWETIGEPRLLVIGQYRMGFVIEAENAGSGLTVHIHYDEPSGAWGVAGRLFGGLYARWCTRSMAEGAVAEFRRG